MAHLCLGCMSLTHCGLATPYSDKNLGSTSAQVMACCPMWTSHQWGSVALYLDQFLRKYLFNLLDEFENETGANELPQWSLGDVVVILEVKSLNTCYGLTLTKRAPLVKLLSPECHRTPLMKLKLVQVMAWCHQATSHYLNQCWPSAMSATMHL